MGITKFEMNVPTFIRDALARVRQADPTAVVAGGCLRDTVFGVPVKDVDVFVGPGFDPARVPLYDGEIILEERGIAMIQSYGSGGDHRGPLAGWSIYPWDDHGFPIQIIRRDFTDVGDLLSDLDFGFCQIAFDGDVWVSEAFVWDRLLNRATYTCPLGVKREQRAAGRADRLARKYPDRRFVFPSLPVATP